VRPKDNEMGSRFSISRYSPVKRVAPVLCFASYLDLLIEIDNEGINKCKLHPLCTASFQVSIILNFTNWKGSPHFTNNISSFLKTSIWVSSPAIIRFRFQNSWSFGLSYRIDASGVCINNGKKYQSINNTWNDAVHSGCSLHLFIHLHSKFVNSTETGGSDVGYGNNYVYYACKYLHYFRSWIH
jgi:hypothetical protein